MKLIALLLLTACVATWAADSDASDSNEDGCWLAAYGRGVGQAISACGTGEEKDGLLCYPDCQTGYTGVGPVCWQTCPSGFTDTGLDCLKPSSYGRGAGYPLWDEGKCNSENSQGCEKSGLLWYPNCDANFHAVGCCVCSPDCPNDMDDIGVSCAKASYGRTAGTPLGCPAGQVEDASLCYPPCDNDFNGIGPVCWGNCPTGFTPCGALCLNDGETCSGKIATLGQTGFQGVLAIVEAVAGGITKNITINTIESVIEFASGLVYPICSN